MATAFLGTIPNPTNEDARGGPDVEWLDWLADQIDNAPDLIWSTLREVADWIEAKSAGAAGEGR